MQTRVNWLLISRKHKTIPGGQYSCNFALMNCTDIVMMRTDPGAIIKDAYMIWPPELRPFLTLGRLCATRGIHRMYAHKLELRTKCNRPTIQDKNFDFDTTDWHRMQWFINIYINTSFKDKDESRSGPTRLSTRSDRWVAVHCGWLCVGNICMSLDV